MRPRETKKTSSFELLFWFGLLALAITLATFLVALIFNVIAESLKEYFVYLPEVTQGWRCLV